MERALAKPFLHRVRTGLVWFSPQLTVEGIWGIGVQKKGNDRRNNNNGNDNDIRQQTAPCITPRISFYKITQSRNKDEVPGTKTQQEGTES